MKKRKVVIFGDSILRPVIIGENSRYTVSDAVNWSAIEDRLDITIENLARMGATIKHGSSQLSGYVEKDNDIFAAVIEFGGNDCDYNWGEVAKDCSVKHPPKTDPDEFESILNNMVDTLSKHRIKPILMTLPPISAKKYYDWIMRAKLNEENIMSHLNDIEIIYRHQEYYSNIIKETALKKGIDLIDVRKNFLLRKDFITLLCADGIHPNIHGEQLIVQSFYDKYA